MKKNGFIATSVLYSLVAILALVMLIIVNNYSSVVKLNREETENIKEYLYDNSSDVIVTWNYVGEEGLKPSEFPQEESGYRVTAVNCTPNGVIGTWNEGKWHLELSFNGVKENNKIRCTITVDAVPED